MKKLVFISALLILALALGGCAKNTLTEYTVSGEILGVSTGQVIMGDRVSTIADQAYTICVTSGQYSMKVLDAEGNQLYEESVIVSTDLKKDVDLSLASLTPEQLAEIQLKKARTQELKLKWNELKATQEIDDPKGDIALMVAGSIGSYGDILLTLDGISSSLSAWAGGHAGLVENSDTVIECFGNKGDLNGVRRWPNDWAIRYDGVDGLRIYGATLNDYSNAKTEAVSHVGKPYNYWFWDITTTSSFYCSQLCWRAWYNQGWDLNDGGAVWPVDLIESPYTYSFYVQ